MVQTWSICTNNGLDSEHKKQFFLKFSSLQGNEIIVSFAALTLKIRQIKYTHLETYKATEKGHISTTLTLGAHYCVGVQAFHCIFQAKIPVDCHFQNVILPAILNVARGVELNRSHDSVPDSWSEVVEVQFYLLGRCESICAPKKTIFIPVCSERAFLEDCFIPKQNVVGWVQETNKQN